MATKQNVLGLIDAGREIRRPPLVGMQFLHQGTVGATDILRGRAGLNAKDLISFLFSHFAAGRRPRPVPRCRISLARAHASRAAGGQDTLQVDRGCRRRSRRASRSASAGRSRRGPHLHAVRREYGRASPRYRDRAPFREMRCGRGTSGRCSSACARRNSPATVTPSRASRGRRAPTGMATPISPRSMRNTGKDQRGGTAHGAQQPRGLLRVGLGEGVHGPQQQDKNGNAEKKRAWLFELFEQPDRAGTVALLQSRPTPSSRRPRRPRPPATARPSSWAAPGANRQ